MVTDTLAMFDGLALTAEEMRRAIRAYAGAEVVWEWRTGPEDEPAGGPLAGDGGDAPAVAYRAAVTVTVTCAGGATTPLLGRGATRAEALGDLLWQLALGTMLGDKAEPARPHLTLLRRG